jgi:hypothetical protein
MAMACFGFLTFLPLRPDLSLPFFMAFISVSTLLPAAGEYLRPEDFFAELFFEEDFFALLLLRPLLFFALAPRLEELLFLALLDFFFAAFFVAITILPRKSDVRRIRVSCIAGCASIMLCGWSSCQMIRVDYTMRRNPGMRTRGSAMSQHAPHASAPVRQNFTSAGATKE